MGMIMGKNRDDIIRILKKTGDTVLVAKADIIYAIAPDVLNRFTKEELLEDIKKRPEAYEYYRAGLLKITEISEAGKEGEKVCPHGTFGGRERCMKCRPELMSDSKPSELCTINEQEQCDEENSLDCLPNKSTCVHGKRAKEITSIGIPDELMKRIMSKKIEPIKKPSISSIMDHYDIDRNKKLGKMLWDLDDEKPITTTELGKELLDKLGAKEFLDKVKIGTGSVNDQHEFDGVKKWEKKED